jgi:hypothetical protein
MMSSKKTQKSSSLEWYFNKGSINKDMLEAGKIFAQHFYKASTRSRIRSCLHSPIKVDVSKTGDTQDMRNEDAYRKLRKALTVLTPTERSVIISVAGLDERASGEKRTQALKTGLRALMVHYGIRYTQLP